jgi:ER-bound oxygenase mpaB/B'/Rubber oxygenase, catalytic domain
VYIFQFFLYRSWASLKKVRRLHFHASKSSEQKGLGKITELELVLTTFGFMGYAFIRPQMFGIQYNNEENRECYIHFWAVIGHALGIEDKYNMCLFSNEVVTQICEIFRRYMFIPLLQVEQPLFKTMAGALVDGYSDYLPMMNYTVLLFLARKFAGIPGYQLDDPVPKETICKSLFTSEELASIRGSMSKHLGEYYTKDICFTEMIPLIEIQSIKASQNSKGSEIYRQLNELDCEYDEDSVEYRLGKYLELKSDEKVSIQYVNENNWSEFLGDAKWKVLGRFDQMAILLRSKMFKNHDKQFFRYLHEASLSAILYVMRKQQK